MPAENANESKAQKLAAARKKLREYQKRGAVDIANSTGNLAAASESHPSSNTGGSNVSSNISEASDCELSTNGHEGCITNERKIISNTASTAIAAGISDEIIAKAVESSIVTPTVSSPGPSTAASYFQAELPVTAAAMLDSFTPTASETANAAHSVIPDTTQQQNITAIQVLITEKTALTTELNNYRSICRERDLELEEVRTQLETSIKRQKELLQHSQQQQQDAEQMCNTNAELQQKLAQSIAKEEDQTAHLDELKRLLNVMQERGTDLENQFKEKCNELEMAQLRIRQLSDEANINQNDNRVETLTQTQFMYEQQIMDLQAMVQQLTNDKEQANNQYQSYVNHLKADISSLNEKNSELMDECAKHQGRERELVEHISALEKEIQKNLCRQDQLKKERELDISPSLEVRTKEIEQLKEQISDFELERHEFQLKIKSQEDRLDTLKTELQEKHAKLEELEVHLNNFANEQPDKTKLLATMESDKVAASRALTQNVELKKQLDELELRFVQLTNDKAELMNKLDAEEHANREMRTNYTEMEERLRSSNELFKFKDDEMIRLSHENMELTSKVAAQREQLERIQGENADMVKDEHHGYNNDQYEHTHEKDDHIAHEQYHEHVDQTEQQNETVRLSHNGYEDKQENEIDYNLDHDHAHHHNEGRHVKQFSTSSSNQSTPHLPTAEAVEKLEQRFMRLMSQVANLTDEKHRLEHLVLQLQGETETIGEYVTLYQTQRRILKQREYEKAAQMQLLQREREQLCQKIAALNNLVNSLSANLPQRMPIVERLNAKMVESNATTGADAGKPLVAEAAEAVEEHVHVQDRQQQPVVGALHEKLSATESRQILTKIQSIISEINENTQYATEVATAPTVDHLNCCLGKFEVV